jgi:hypothetical protein
MSATVSTLLQDINIKDGNFVDRLDNRTLYQANDYKLQLTFLDGNDRADGTDLAFSFVVQSTSGEVFDIAGSWTTATSGEGTITVPAASLNFTGTGYIGLIRFNGSVVAEFPLVVKAYGTPAPEAGTMIDWSIYTGYSNTATHGPVRPGTGITNVVNADGSNTHSVTYGSSASTAAEGNDARLSDARTPTAHASTHATGGSDPVTAADVDVAGTAIAGALLAKANDNAVVKLTGETLQTVEGSITVGNLLKTMNGAGAIVGSNINVISSVELVSADGWRIRQGSDNAILENLRDLGNLYLRAFVSGNTAGDLYLNDIGGNTIVPILKALATTGLVVQNSAGTEKLKVGAATGADVQVTGDLSVTEKQATAYQNTDTRTATMTGDETLTISSAICQFLDPADSDRNLDLPDSSLFVVQNTGDGGEIITVRDSSDVTIDTVDNGVTLTFIYDGTNWQVLG